MNKSGRIYPHPCSIAPLCKPPFSISKKQKSISKSQNSYLKFSPVVKDICKMILGIMLLCIAGLIGVLVAQKLLFYFGVNGNTNLYQLLVGMIVVLVVFKLVSNYTYKIICNWIEA